MCVSNSPANFTGTKGYIGEAQTKELGLVHVLGYQNKVENKVSQPNAMILHFPAAESMGKNNVIDLGAKGKNLLTVMCSSFGNNSRSLTKSFYLNSAKVEVFNTGIYTVVISSKPSLITEVLQQVPENRRPNISSELMQWYEDHYPNYAVAVCCFNTSEQVESEPLFWWYKPMNEAELFFPAIDCHTGNVPNLAEKVDVDHILTCALSEFSDEANSLLRLNKSTFIEEKNQVFFPEKYIGKNFQGMFGQVNGDFIIKKEDVKKGEAKFERVSPKKK